MSPSKKTAWSEVVPKIRFPQLKENLAVDVAIVGGGISGLLTAYLLARAGKQVAILESDQLLSGATLYTTAFLTHVIDTDATDMISMYGLKDSKLIWQSHKEAIDLIEQIIKDEQIDCEFVRCSNYAYANEPEEFSYLEEEHQAMKKLGIDCSLKRSGNLGFPHHGYIEVKNQAKFHPIKFLAGIAVVLQEMGVLIFERTKVEKISSGKQGAVAKIKDHSVKAQWVITATYDPLNNPKKTFMKKGMYVSYVYELEVPPGLLKQGIYEDLNNPYHYFRVDPQGRTDRVIIGGEDNREEIAYGHQKNFNALTDYINKLLYGHQYKVVRKWTGPILEPSDGLALIGQFKPHQLVAAAFSGNGMTYAGISAMIFHDLVLGKKNKHARIYDPTRIPTAKQLLKKGQDYAEEFFKGALRNTIKY